MWKKHSLDFIASAVALVVLAPLFVVVALLIKRDSPGPVFYRGERVGKAGKPFRIFKFRTMVVDADKKGPLSTAADDPRITRVGHFVKRFNLDELPQFINVLSGEMSIVGPRPEVAEVVALYSEADREAILSVRPGITDWATLWVRDEGERLRGSADPHQQYLDEIWPEKRRLQLKYVREQSVMTDLRIMLLTLKTHLIDRIRASASG